MSSGKQKLISQVTAAEAPAIVCWHNAEGQGTQEDQMLDQSTRRNERNPEFDPFEND
jgi:hypothetical protein